MQATIFGIVCVLLGVARARPSVVSASYQVSNSTILGTRLSYAFYTVNLSEELYVTTGVACTSDAQCQKFPKHCPPKNYAIKDSTCGNIPEKYITSSEGCAQEERLKLSCTDHFIPLQEGVSSQYMIVENGQILEFRFYFDKSCRAVEFKHKLDFGRIEVHPDRQRVSEHYEGETITYCPKGRTAEGGIYRYGTLVWEVSALQRSNFSVSVVTHELSESLPAERESSSCQPGAPNTVCLEEGVPSKPVLLNHLLNVQRFSYRVQECQQLQVVIEPSQTQYNLVITKNREKLFNSTELFASKNSLTLSFPISTWFFEMCPTDSNSDGYVFFVVDTPRKFRFSLTVFKERESWKRIPITSLQPSSWIHMRGAARLECPEESGTTTFNCGAQTVAPPLDSCYTFFPVVPLEYNLTLWPVPALLRLLDPYKYDLVGFVEETNFQPKSYHAVAILDVVSSYTNYSPISNWESKLPACRIVINEFQPLSNVFGQGIMADTIIEPVLQQPQCDRNLYHLFSHRLLGYVQQIALPRSAEAIISIRYRADLLTFASSWSACQQTTESLLTKVNKTITMEKTTNCFSSKGTEAFEDDPCCSITERETSCCLPRDQQYSQMNPETPIKSKVKTVCSHPKCAESYLEEYVLRVSKNIIEIPCSNVLATNLGDYLRVRMSFFYECKRRILGNDAEERKCFSDDDCLVSFRCDVIQGVCITDDFSAQENAFYKCLVETIPVNIKTSLIRGNPQLNSRSKEEFTAKLKTVTTRNVCIDNKSIMTGRRVHYETQTASYQTVLGCDMVKCVGIYCRIPTPCLQFPWVPVGENITSEQDCKILATNVGYVYPPQIPVDDTTLKHTATPNSSFSSPDFFCGLCDDPTNCIKFSRYQSKEQCEKAFVCIEPISKEIIEGITEAECAAIRRCSIGSSGEGCEECSGVCRGELWDYVGHMDKILRPNFIREGVCVGKFSDPSRRTCDSTGISLDFPTNEGCVRESEVAIRNSNESDCLVLPQTDNLCITFVRQTKKECLSAGYRWVKKPLTKKECLQSMACEDTGFPPGYVSLLPPPECLQCEGTPRTFYSWEEGKCLGGVYRKLSWKKEEMIEKYEWRATVDFYSLATLLANAVIDTMFSQIAIDLQCGVGVVSTIVRSVLCDCPGLSGDGKESTDCYDEDKPEIGIQLVCPQVESFVVAPPVKLRFFGERDEESSYVANCAVLSLELEFLRSLQAPITKPFATVFVPPQIADNEDQLVYNEDGAIVGEGLGNGVSISIIYDATRQNFSFADVRFELCLLRLLKQGKSSGNKIAAFGKKRNDVGLEPIKDLKVVEVNSTMLCANVSLGISTNFFPIEISKDWEDENAHLSPDQKALMYIIASFYVLISIPIIFILFSLLLPFKMNPKLLMWLFLLFLSIFRSVYFYLVGAGVMGKGTELSDFIIFELPTFFFLSANTIVGGFFLELMLRTLRMRNVNERRSMTSPWFIIPVVFLNTLTYALFVIVAVLFEVLKDEQTSECAGRDLTQDDLVVNQSALVIRLVYKSVVLGVAALTALLLTISGSGVSIQLRPSPRQNKLIRSSQAKKQMHVLIHVWVLSFGLVTSCLAFIIYYIVNDPHPLFAIVLIPTEIIPIFLVQLLYMRTPSSSSNSKISDTTPTAERRSPNS